MVQMLTSSKIFENDYFIFFKKHGTENQAKLAEIIGLNEVECFENLWVS